MKHGDVVSRRKMFGTFLAAAVAPLAGKVRAALGWSPSPAIPQDNTAADLYHAVTTYVCDSKGHLVNVIEPHVGEVTAFAYDGVLPWDE